MLEIARYQGSQITVSICIERRNASLTDLFGSILGHLKEVVGIVFNYHDVWEGTVVRTRSTDNREANRIQHRCHKLLAFVVRLSSVAMFMSVTAMQVPGDTHRAGRILADRNGIKDVGTDI